MFKPPRDLLKEYLSSRPELEKTHQRQACLDAVSSLALRLLRWCDAHFGLLHHLWVYGLALIVSVMVLEPSYGWVNLAVVPVQVAFMGGIIALAELPLMLALSLIWGIGAAMTAWVWKSVAKTRQ